MSAKLKELAVISGKGGAGKTTLTAAFASLAGAKAMVADCDVDAPDLHLIFRPNIVKKKNFFGLKLAVKDEEKCTSCGLCLQHCRFDAITSELEIVAESCEGCGVCGLVCPEDAISLQEQKAGELFISDTRVGPFVHARLRPGKESSGKLVEQVRFQARELALELEKELVIIDGPPGIGCPVVASISGATLVVIITEPSLSGISDMERAVELTRYFKVPVVLGINKYDINLENTQRIEAFCQKEGIPVIGRLPYDNVTTAAMLQEQSVVEFSAETGKGTEFVSTLEDMWGWVLARLEEE